MKYFASPAKVLAMAFLAASSVLFAGGEAKESWSIKFIIEKIEAIKREQSASRRADAAEELTMLIRQAASSGNIKSVNYKMIDDIQAMLSDSSDSVRMWTAGTLGLMGPKACRSVPALEKALSEIRAIDSGKIIRPEVTSEGAIQLALIRITGGSVEAVDGINNCTARR
jgi:hypothetical protein